MRAPTKLMRTLATAAFALGSFFLAQRYSSSSAHPGHQAIRLDLTFPPGTPMDTIYVAGSLPQVGSWNAEGKRVRRTGPTTGRVEIEIAPEETLEFKITRGSWATVEKNIHHEDIPNRVLSGSSGEKIVRIHVESWADSGTGSATAPAPRRHTLSGDIRFHENFRSDILDNSRALAVYLPPGYDSAKESYPVLYMHDGQNIFDAATSFIGVEWEVDEACEELISSGAIPPMIVVGISNNSERVAEYTPVATDTRGGGRGDDYARFVIEEVKPFIDKTYRTTKDREHTGIMGSSLGGLISLHMAWTRPDVFSKAGVVSPALWWADSEILRRIAISAPPQPFPKFWIDMGTKEGNTHSSFNEGIANVRDLAASLRSHGFRDPEDFILVEAEGADHSERAWSARIRDILRYLYGAPSSP
ncbi:MAG: alpha/beta hydrolase-fold protein [Candidatus Hydrogenedentota bacterium]